MARRARVLTPVVASEHDAVAFLQRTHPYAKVNDRHEASRGSSRGLPGAYGTGRVTVPADAALFVRARVRQPGPPGTYLLRVVRDGTQALHVMALWRKAAHLVDVETVSRVEALPGQSFVVYDARGRVLNPPRP